MSDLLWHKFIYDKGDVAHIAHRNLSIHPRMPCLNGSKEEFYVLSLQEWKTFRPNVMAAGETFGHLRRESSHMNVRFFSCVA